MGANVRKRSPQRQGGHGRRTGKGSSADLLLAPFVVVMRLPVLCAEAASGGIGRTESHLAVNEKITAGVEGIWEAQLSMLNAAFDFWPDVLSGRHPVDLLADSWVQASRAALRPASLTVRRNFDRLSRG